VRANCYGLESLAGFCTFFFGRGAIGLKLNVGVGSCDFTPIKFCLVKAGV
jgi:hypothetical protein